MGVHALVRELEVLTRSVVASTAPEIRLALPRIAKLSRHQLGNPSDTSSTFFRTLGETLLRLRGSASAELRLSCLIDCCRFGYVTGAAQDAIRIAEHALDLARRSGRKEEQRRVLSLLGALHADLGARAHALEYHAQAIALAIQIGMEAHQYAAWTNASAVLLDSGLYAEAIDAANSALSFVTAGGVDSRDHIARCKTNIALAYHFMGANQRALVYANDAIRLSPVPATHIDAHSRLVREENLIMILVGAGRISEAREHAQSMLKIAASFPSKRADCITRMCVGLTEVFGGDATLGVRLLEDVAADEQSRMGPIKADALLALARAYEAMERPEEALQRLQELLAFLRNERLQAIRIHGGPAEHEDPHLLMDRGADLKEHDRAVETLKVKVLQRELTRSRQEILERMAVAADIREDISGEHGYRVGLLSSLLAREIGWDRDSCNALDIAARLHDIGKVGISDKILLSKETLKQAEKHFIASHTMMGAEILSRSDIPQVRIAEEIALCHHEWWDGSGYPRQLKDTSIPKSARIVALADSFDAMTHGRPYADPISIEAALDQIAALRGRQFDPELTDHFLALVRRLVAEHRDLDAYLGKAARNSPFLKARARIKEMLAQGRDSGALSGPEPASGSALN